MLLILLSVASAVGIGLLLEPLFNDNDSSENNENSENTQQNTTNTVLLQNAGVAENAINGNENGNSLRGTLGADVINGFGGDDRIQSGSGDDTISAGAGDDTTLASHGNDVVDLGAGNDQHNPLQHDNRFDHKGNDTIEGGVGNDLIREFWGDDVLDGGSGDDTVSAVDFYATANGNDNNGDIVNGGEGDDILIADALDTLTGGDGNDTFQIGVLEAETENAAIIKDFAPGKDLIRIEHVNDPKRFLSHTKKFLADKNSYIYIELPDTETAEKVSKNREEFCIEHINCFTLKSLNIFFD
ncbi:MAG: calcium-binding protein, partial [Rhodobacteraceae bacterium]|nr:calcium-binding protein [Paracoccaceae bacterium]